MNRIDYWRRQLDREQRSFHEAIDRGDTDSAAFWLRATLRSSMWIDVLLGLAAFVLLAGCGGSSFHSSSADPCSYVTCTDGSTLGAEGPDAPGGQSDGAASAEGGRETSTRDAGPHDANPSPEGGEAACQCGSSSCWYSTSEPAVASVATIKLTPSQPTATVTATITTPATPDHDAAWFDLDVSAYPKGATLLVSGQVGSGATDGSAFLLDECDAMPASGPFMPASPGANVGNVAPGDAWSFQAYAFGPGTTVLHLGTEGSWYNASVCPSCATGATNTNTITVRVQ